MRTGRILGGTAILFATGFALAYGLTTAFKPAPDSGIDWVSVQDAYKNTAQTPGNKKFVFVHVTTDWCGWCRKMEAATYSQPAVYSYLNQHFYSVKLNAERKDAIQLGNKKYEFVAQGGRGYHELAAEMCNGRMSYPTIVLLKPDFQTIQPIPGYQDADRLLQILRFFGDDHYNQMQWDEYQNKYATLYPNG